MYPHHQHDNVEKMTRIKMDRLVSLASLLLLFLAQIGRAEMLSLLHVVSWCVLYMVLTF